MRKIALTLAAAAPIMLGQASVASAQASLPQIDFLSPTDAERILRSTGAKVTRAEDPSHFLVVLPSGAKADAQLQNCEDRKSASNCRTLSVILTLAKPKEMNRAALLDFINEFNQHTVSVIIYLDEKNDVVLRFVFITTGNETIMSGAQKFAIWRQEIGRFASEISQKLKGK